MSDTVKQRNIDKLESTLASTTTTSPVSDNNNSNNNGSNNNKNMNKAPSPNRDVYILPTNTSHNNNNKANKRVQLTNNRNTKSSNFQKMKVHAVDGKEEDRKKFYHESVLENKTPTQELDRYDKFLVWLKENNALFPDQYLKKYSEDVRGVHAEKDIPADKQIATVPLKLLIHEGMGQETEYGKRVHNTENNIIVPNHTQVIIYLLSTGARYWAKPNGKCTSFF